jgi:hypothetical protein
MAKAIDIQKFYSQYLGFTPSSKDVSSMAMMSNAQVEDVIKNSKTEVQSQATNKANEAIASLGEGGDYLSKMMQGQTMLADRYGLTEAEKRMGEAEEFYRSIAEKGPMLKQVMTGELQQASPTFLGATRKDLEEYFAHIENPFVRDSMVNNMLTSADKSMVATLNALNGLYQTSLMAAQNAVESERSNYQNINNKVKDLYSELQWINRLREQERIGEASEKDSSSTSKYSKEWEELGGFEGTGRTKNQWVMERIGMEDLTPKAWSDEELRIAFRNIQETNGNYQTALDEISMESTMANKDYARELAAEFFGIKTDESKNKLGGGFWDLFKPKDNKEKKDSQLEKEPSSTGAWGDYWDWYGEEYKESSPKFFPDSVTNLFK